MAPFLLFLDLLRTSFHQIKYKTEKGNKSFFFTLYNKPVKIFVEK